MRGVAPAFTERFYEERRGKEPQGTSPASATCLRILSALATLTTGPREVSGLVGSPKTYFYLSSVI